MNETKDSISDLNKINIAFNMETSDPDDALTLCLLATHPRVNLCGITVTPGSKAQIAVVKHLLEKLSCSHIPVGSKNIEHPKQCVSEFHYKWLGKSLSGAVAMADGTGEEILKLASEAGNLKIVSGAPMGCVGKFLEKYNIQIPEIVIQGGFAGDSVVPIEHRLDKFMGRETCPTFNLNGDVPAARMTISSSLVSIKRLVSKNVCHGVIYDQEMHERIKPFKNNNIGLNLLVCGMEQYLLGNKNGKAFHDPLAACVAINPEVCTFKEVEVYREKGEWGSKISSNTNTFISIALDRDKFEKVLVGRNLNE